MNLLFITAPIFLLILLGYILRTLGGITKDNIYTLNNFVYWVSLPALILVSFWGINWFDESTRTVLLVNTVALLAFAGILFFVLGLLPIHSKTKAGIFVAALVGNTIYMGFPIGQRALGEGAYDLFLAAATPHLVIGIAISIMAIEWYMLRSSNPLRYVKEFFCNPLIVSLVAGMVLSISQISNVFVDLLREPITMLAATASPIALVTLGAFLRGVFEFRLAGLSLIAASLNLLALPLVVYGVGQAFLLNATTVAASVLAAAMPTAVTSFVIAEKYNAAPKLVATALCISTVCSLGTITLLLFLLF